MCIYLYIHMCMCMCMCRRVRLYICTCTSSALLLVRLWLLTSCQSTPTITLCKSLPSGDCMHVGMPEGEYVSTLPSTLDGIKDPSSWVP